MEGQNLTIEQRFADERSERVPALAAELANLNLRSAEDLEKAFTLMKRERASGLLVLSGVAAAASG